MSWRRPVFSLGGGACRIPKRTASHPDSIIPVLYVCLPACLLGQNHFHHDQYLKTHSIKGSFPNCWCYVHVLFEGTMSWPTLPPLVSVFWANLKDTYMYRPSIYTHKYKRCLVSSRWPLWRANIDDKHMKLDFSRGSNRFCERVNFCPSRWDTAVQGWCNRLRDPAGSRNLGPIFCTIPVLVAFVNKDRFGDSLFLSFTRILTPTPRAGNRNYRSSSFPPLIISALTKNARE